MLNEGRNGLSKFANLLCSMCRWQLTGGNFKFDAMLHPDVITIDSELKEQKTTINFEVFFYLIG